MLGQTGKSAIGQPDLNILRILSYFSLERHAVSRICGDKKHSDALFAVILGQGGVGRLMCNAVTETFFERFYCL